MHKFWASPLLLLVLVGASSAQAPPAGKTMISKADYAQEAFVFELLSHKEKFEKDGTSVRENAGRVRIQSEAGAQRYGVLSFSYASGTGSFAIDYVRVHKPDGSVVETPADNVQDMTAEITRQAPLYSDLHEKHVAVKGLSVGDVLEYKVEEHTTKPLAPGQFWMEYTFENRAIVLNEELEVSVPRERAVKLKSRGVDPVISEAGGYRVYAWHLSNLQRKDDADKREQMENLWQAARGRLPQADVLMSSFGSWEEVGRWYGELQEERVKPTPEISAKAAELTKGATTDEEKIRNLYNYVSTQFRYIGIDLGIGRYQPHTASDVLANQYGDCKDKHTLLASLLTAAGIPAYPALISTTREVEEDVPSPGQFNHVITVVRTGGERVWLDTTAEVGPYGYLISPLRNKHALVVWKDKAPALAETPAGLPFPGKQTFTMDAKLSDEGTLEGQANLTVRGDVEFLLRAAFRRAPLTQWKELGQQISQSTGFGGEVSEVTASPPEKTDDAFHVAYKYIRKGYGDWPNRRVVSPLPFISLTAPDDDDAMPKGALWLGELSEIEYRSQMELPHGYHPDLPRDVHFKRDFVEYDATYAFKDGKVISERHLKTLMREVPAGEHEEYKQLSKALQDDYAAFIPISSSSEEASTPAKNSPEGLAAGLANLPDTTNEEALRLARDAVEQMDKHNLAAAVSSLYRAVGADPKFVRAWVMLGSVLLMQQQYDAAKDAFAKAEEADPKETAIPKVLGMSLMEVSRFEDAVPVWQEYVKGHPEDVDGAMNLGMCLGRLRRYPEAAAAYESAIKANPKRADLLASLASMYLQANQRDKAGPVLHRLTEMDPSGNTLNDVAYQMASNDFELPLALDYARKAVKSAEGDSQKITLADLKLKDVRQIFTISAYWDTLGWVNERMSNLEEAEKYLQASWKLTQDGVVAGHLCHMYRREHKTAQAIEMCQFAINRVPMSVGLTAAEAQVELAAARENLKLLTGGANSKSMVDASDKIVRARNYKMARFLPGTESAEFFVLLSSDGKSGKFHVEDTKFVSGSEKMKAQGKQLKTIDFQFVAPDGGATRFVRRGILGCYQYTGCSFLLLDAASVNSVE